MKVKLATAFAAGFLAAVVLGFVVPASNPLCRTGYMTKGIGAERAKELEDFADGVVDFRTTEISADRSSRS